ncbi:MAG: hypothetical protein ACKV2Q_28100 [Planctomycetaceae bacterium]
MTAPTDSHVLAIPEELKALKQWCLWKTVVRDGLSTKMPFQANGQPAKSNDPTTWTSFDKAWAECAIPKKWSGIGFVFSADDPYCGIDLDGCRNPSTGEIAPWAAKLVHEFATYCEISPSETGVKLWVRGRWNFEKHKQILADAAKVSDKTPAIEVYDSGRYFAVTGAVLNGQCLIGERQERLDQLGQSLWSESARQPTGKPSGKAATDARSAAPHDRATVISRAAAYLAKVPGAISGQGGSDATIHAACELFRFGLTDSEALAVFDDFNSRCEPPWNDREIDHKLTDARDKVIKSGEFGCRLTEERPQRPSKKSNKPNKSKSSNKTSSSTTEITFGILDKLENVVRLSPFQWHATCPISHEENSKSLTITVQIDGKAKFNCVCGSAWEDIVLAAGGIASDTYAQREIVESNSSPLTGQKPKSENENVIRNFEMVSDDDGDEQKAQPLPIDFIAKVISKLTGGWPRRVGQSLFVPNDGRLGVSWLLDTDALFAFFGRATGHPPEFKAMAGLHTKRELFSDVIRTATEYAAVEELPHEPPMPGHYYCCDVPSSGSGQRLHDLVERFSPETDIDRDLILAAFVTPFWGGRGGTRPAFCVTNDMGKGSGKSKLAEFIGQLAGGALDVSANEDIAALKSRLLSPSGATKRVVWLDNVKTHRLSWAELESLITTPAISGKRLYVGEGQRPNNLTFLLTMNGVSLSTDMAQRSVIIKLRRPDYSGTWTDETCQFIELHRRELVADVLGFLRSPVNSLSKFSRWGDWERDVLARLPEPSEAQAVIRERQVGVDVDGEESALIQEFFAKQLAWFGYDTKDNRVFIPSRVAARWLGWATNDKTTVAKASRLLKQKITEGQLRQILEVGRKDLGRGFEYWGDDATGETYLQRDLEEQIKLRGENPVA